MKNYSVSDDFLSVYVENERASGSPERFAILDIALEPDLRLHQNRFIKRSLCQFEMVVSNRGMFDREWWFNVAPFPQTWIPLSHIDAERYILQYQKNIYCFGKEDFSFMLLPGNSIEFDLLPGESMRLHFLLK